MQGVVSSVYRVPHLIVPEERLVISQGAKTHLILAVKSMFNLLGEFDTAAIKINVKLASSK